ncbi:MAG: hypothetical protein PF569_06775 [Candidatus Woesearchaeota archaeon]|jgi:hypothetical protein|nr:hypothetical protein [Candidatus Woesearchaeota archaeon]
MELVYNYISFNESSGTLLVKTEIESDKSNHLKLVKILKRIGNNLSRVKSSIDTLKYDDIIAQNFLDATDGEYSTINDFRIDAESLEEDENGFEESESYNVCYISVSNSREKLNIKTQFEWPIYYDRNNYLRFMKSVINFHKASYIFDLSKEYSFAKGYNNIDVLYDTYLQNLGNRFNEGIKKNSLKAVK